MLISRTQSKLSKAESKLHTCTGNNSPDMELQHKTNISCDSELPLLTCTTQSLFPKPHQKIEAEVTVCRF